MVGCCVHAVGRDLGSENSQPGRPESISADADWRNLQEDRELGDRVWTDETEVVGVGDLGMYVVKIYKSNSIFSFSGKIIRAGCKTI